MLNPFESDKEELVHLASGAVANPTIATDMKTMLEKGKLAEERRTFLEANPIFTPQSKRQSWKHSHWARR